MCMWTRTLTWTWPCGWPWTAKTQNVSVCNAMETLLVHRDVAEAFLPPWRRPMGAKGVQLRGDEATRALIACDPATEADWDTEYLDLILSIRVVDSLERP